MTPLSLILLIALSLHPAGSDADQRQKREHDEAIGKLTELQEKLKTEYGDQDTRVKGLVKALENTKTDLSKNPAQSTSAVDFGAISVRFAVTAVVGALPKFKSNEPLQIAGAVADVLSSVTSLIPGPYGAAISTIFAVAGGLIGMTSKTPNMAKVVESIIKEQLKIERQNELADEVAGAKREFDSLHCILAAALWDTPQETDILFINSQAGNQVGLRIMGILESYISRDSHEVNSRQDFDEHMKLTKLYVELSNIRLQLLHMMHSLYHQSELTTTTEKGLLAAIDSTKQIDRNLFEFYSSPDPDQAYLAARLIPEKYPTVARYFTNLEIDLQKTHDDLVANECGYYMFNAKESWNEYYIADCGSACKKQTWNGPLETYIKVYDGGNPWGKSHPRDKDGRGVFLFQKQGDSVIMTTKTEGSGRLKSISDILGPNVANSRTDNPTTYRFVKTNMNTYYWMSSDSGNSVIMSIGGPQRAHNNEIGDFAKSKSLWNLRSAC